MKINNFRGDLTDNSAKKEAPVQTLVNALYHRGIRGGLQKAPTSLEELRKLRIARELRILPILNIVIFDILREYRYR